MAPHPQVNDRPTILRIAVPSPLRTSFDYRPPVGVPIASIQPGVRLRIPFGRSTRIGILLAKVNHSELAPDRLKAALQVLDPEPLLPRASLDFLLWTSRYYHHPIGETLFTALPVALRRGAAATRSKAALHWRPSATGRAVDATTLGRAPRQQAVLQALQSHSDGLDEVALRGIHKDWRCVLKTLQEKAWVESCDAPQVVTKKPARDWQPNTAQQLAIETVDVRRGCFQPYLLDGVTGSGKTEVYLELAERTIAAGQQVLILVPEIGLSPQMISRYQRRLQAPFAVLHSGLSQRERLDGWLAARDGEAAIVIGTRSAIFVPLARPGLFIVDEEHDPSYKQQDGLRYSARDLAVIRARNAAAPIVLGSATPSLESLRNVEAGRYERLHLPARVGNARPPGISIIDLRKQPPHAPLAPPLLSAMERCLEKGEQALLFVNRRGYAPVYLCHSCGAISDCPRCDAHMVLHQKSGRLRCHHCGTEQAPPSKCPACGAAAFIPVGAGTQRISTSLQERLPKARILRIDRDSTRRKGAMEGALEQIHAGEVDILVGTQMLAKGHHFPKVTLVGILDADGGLFGTDFRASERLAQLIVQVAGRAGRGERPGQVYIQTHHPDHRLLHALVEKGYENFAQAALRERQEAALPPYSWLALLRAEAPTQKANFGFLEAARSLAEKILAPGLMLLGPVPAVMERRRGRYRARLLMQADSREVMQTRLDPWLDTLQRHKSARRVRWSLDIDPVEVD